MSAEIITFKEPRELAVLTTKLPALFLPHETAADRFFGFFTANIRNKNTRVRDCQSGARAGIE